MLIGLLIRSRFRTPEELDPGIKTRIRRIFRRLGVDLQIEFEEDLPPDRPFIFMANHTSLIDVPLLQAGVPRYFVGILAKHQFKFFLYGKAVQRLGHLAIDRNNPRQSLKVFQQAARHLKAGTSIVVLPEGGRSLDGHLMPFKKLPFRFAMESETAIVPVSISGAFQMKPKGSWRLVPGKLVLRFGSIIAVESPSKMDLNVLRDRVYHAIYEGLESLEKGELCTDK